MTELQTTIRRLKRDKGVSLRQISRDMDYDVGYLSRVVSGKNRFTVKLANDLCNQYELDTGARLRLFQEVTSMYGVNPADMRKAASAIAK